MARGPPPAYYRVERLVDQRESSERCADTACSRQASSARRIVADGMRRIRPSASPHGEEHLPRQPSIQAGCQMRGCAYFGAPGPGSRVDAQGVEDLRWAGVQRFETPSSKRTTMRVPRRTFRSRAEPRRVAVGAHDGKHRAIDGGARSRVPQRPRPEGRGGAGVSGRS